MRRLLCFFAIVLACDAYNILVATPAAVKSESYMVMDMAYDLANAGHKVTFITGYKGPQVHKNLTVIWLPEVQNLHENPGIDFEVQESLTSLFTLVEFYYKQQNEKAWSNHDVLKVWEKRKKFDLFVTMSFFSEGMFPFLLDNDIPMAQILTMGLDQFAFSYQGNWITPAVLPSMLTEFEEDMTFWERSVNLYSTLMFHYFQRNVIPKYCEPVTKIFPNIGHYFDYFDRVALTLINSHFAMDGPMPLLPNQVEVGTINIKKPQPLDKELEAFMKGAGDAGIILFSLGSVSKSSDLPQSGKEALVEAFGRIPQRVLWKYEDTDLKMPPNVLIKKWMPQQDILRHPKTKVFISHCGTFSAIEAKYFGVPVLGFPLLFDQFRNAAKMVKKNYAITLPWDNLNADAIVESLNTLVNDTSYKERMEAISRLLQDQKETPAERAVWWLEYVARHKGSPHLQYAGKRLSLFQYVMLDVILFWLSAFLVVVFGVVYLIRILCCGRNRKVDDKQLTKKKKQ